MTTVDQQRQSAFHQALCQWQADLGREHVLVEPDILRASACTTMYAGGTIRAILRPASLPELRLCIAGARKWGMALTVSSGGRNWGFGGKAPVQDGSVLIELGRMNRISALDRELAVVTVEPGVTFRQLANYLRATGAGLFVAVTGGAADASVIGNAVERGTGIGPTAQRAATIGGFEVVLPCGRCVRTGLTGWPNARASSTGACDAGPAIEGLFLQSNLGIVTKLVLRLDPLPQVLTTFQARASGVTQLGAVVDRLRGALLRGALGPSSISMWNSYKMLAREMSSTAPAATQYLAPALRDGWFIGGGLYSCTEQHAAVACQSLREVLGTALDQIRSADHAALTPAEAMLVGQPNDRNLRSMYWRKPQPAPDSADPDRDRCGFIWVCTTLPMHARDVAVAVTLAQSTVVRAGFEPQIGLQVLHPRALEMFVAIAYDRDQATHDERALACHDALIAALAGAGYYPSRLGIQSMAPLPGADADTAHFLHTLKRAIDPAGMFAPGRYDQTLTGPPSWRTRPGAGR